ncbi:MAG: hypothetical protein WCD21_33820 [Streptomyces sp.]
MSSQPRPAEKATPADPAPGVHPEAHPVDEILPPGRMLAAGSLLIAGIAATLLQTHLGSKASPAEPEPAVTH